MLFAPGAPREAYFEGFSALADMTDDERRSGSSATTTTGFSSRQVALRSPQT